MIKSNLFSLHIVIKYMIITYSMLDSVMALPNIDDVFAGANVDSVGKVI